MNTIYKVAAILGFPKYAIYFKLNYFKLIHLQANMLSSFIFTYFAVNHTNLPQKCLSVLENTRSEGGCHMLHPQQWWYTNLTNYEFPCKIRMQLSRNSYTNQGRTYQGFFILTYYNMVFKMAYLYLVLDKRNV